MIKRQNDLVSLKLILCKKAKIFERQNNGRQNACPAAGQG
jgi:hypothetical protein